MTKFSGHIFEMINNWRHNRKEYDSAKKIQMVETSCYV